MSASRRNTRWITVTALVFVLAIGLAFAAGQFIRSDHSQAIENAGITPTVTAVVEEKTLTVAVPTATGTVSVGRTWPLHVSSGEFENSVVTHVAVELDTQISSGNVLGRVSGRPVIVLNLPFSLYRDITDGDVGDDVRALQEALKSLSLYTGEVDGVYGASTAQAVTALYRNNGLVPPSSPDMETESTSASQPVSSQPGLAPVRMSEIVAIPEMTATINSIASIGDVANMEVPFAVLRSGPSTVTARIGAGSQDVFPEGVPVTVSLQTDSRINVAGTVVSVSEFRTTDPDVEGSIPGYDITIEIPDDDALTDGTVVTVTGEESAGTATGLTLPVTAIREQDGRTYVVLSDETRVPVEVILVSDGFALIEGDLVAGDMVGIAVEP